MLIVGEERVGGQEILNFLFPLPFAPTSCPLLRGSCLTAQTILQYWKILQFCPSNHPLFLCLPKTSHPLYSQVSVPLPCPSPPTRFFTMHHVSFLNSFFFFYCTCLTFTTEKLRKGTGREVCSSENIHTLPTKGFLFCTPVPPGNFSLAACFASKILTLRSLFP